MRLFITLALLTLTAPTFADVAAAQKLTQQLQAMDSLQGKFEQTVTDKKGAKLQSTQGQFTIKRPGYFLWETHAPNEQVVIGNPQKLWVYDPDLEQVTVRPQNAQADNSPARLLSGDFASLAPQFEVSNKSQAKTDVFTLVPKNKNAENFSEIQFGFVEGKLAKLSFVDKLGQQTALNLQDTKSNVPVDLKIFTFVPKPGTDVIEND